jgi:hypothetical protein
MNLIPIRPLIRRRDGAYKVPTNRPDRFGIISAVDRAAVAKFNWHAYSGGLYSRTYYLARSLPRNGSKTQRVFGLHRFIARRMGLDVHRHEVDHRNRHGFDCRRKNIRLAREARNQWNTPLRTDNTSGVKGVCWHIHAKRWYATIRVNRKKIYLGCFKSFTAAAKARRAAVRKYHGAFRGQETR